jgi:hypothetical protein
MLPAQNNPSLHTTYMKKNNTHTPISLHLLTKGRNKQRNKTERKVNKKNSRGGR